MGHKVVDQLTADGRHYDGRQVIEILRAIRNVAEHWFQPRTAQEEAALEVHLTRLCLMACYAHVCVNVIRRHIYCLYNAIVLKGLFVRWQVLTGASAEETQAGQATAQAAARRAAVIERVFLSDGDGSFAELLLVFAMANSPSPS